MASTILGIVNITEDSFSDGGRYLETIAAIDHAHELAMDGADVLDLGAASSNIDSTPVPPEVEIARLAPLVEALHKDGRVLSIDSFSTPVQRWALEQGVAYLNDIQGFADPALYPDLARSPARLILMHSVQGRGKATETDVAPAEIYDRVVHFFEQRIAALTMAGVARDRLILDPGMGFFLSSNPETSLEVLRRLPDLKAHFGLPVLIGVSRKSFLRRITNRQTSDCGAVTLAAELFAASAGADYIRTHDAACLADGLKFWQAAAGSQ
ncbi:MAG: dihydropteroate synthase [Rhizomicrobium sp.]